MSNTRVCFINIRPSMRTDNLSKSLTQRYQPLLLLLLL